MLELYRIGLVHIRKHFLKPYGNDKLTIRSHYTISLSNWLSLFYLKHLQLRHERECAVFAPRLA